MIKRYEESASGMIEDDEGGTYVDHFAYLELEAENAILKERIAHIVKTNDAEIDRLREAWEEMNTKRLRYREALEEILKVYSPSPVKTYQTMEDIAKQALEVSNE